MGSRGDRDRRQPGQRLPLLNPCPPRGPPCRAPQRRPRADDRRLDPARSGHSGDPAAVAGNPALLTQTDTDAGTLLAGRHRGAAQRRSDRPADRRCSAGRVLLQLHQPHRRRARRRSRARNASILTAHHRRPADQPDSPSPPDSSRLSERRVDATRDRRKGPSTRPLARSVRPAGGQSTRPAD